MRESVVTIDKTMRELRADELESVGGGQSSVPPVLKIIMVIPTPPSAPSGPGGGVVAYTTMQGAHTHGNIG
jgi:hypothetical protein